jgi:hypothetical protein
MLFNFVVHVDYKDGSYRNYYFKNYERALKKKNSTEKKNKRVEVTLFNYPMPLIIYQ